MDEILYGLLVQDLNNLKVNAEKIAIPWNGDDPGIMEDKARCAEEIIKKVDELIELLNELHS